MDFLKDPTRTLFFAGKGGVGKTSIACAAAVVLADMGRRVLLVSTDPASNLDEVLGVPLATAPTAVPSVPGLFAMNIDPEAAAREYRDRVVGPYRGLLPEAALASMEEQLSGACTVEIAAFDKFSELLGDPEATRHFDHVLFDTAPTGHTLRLLKLPSAWTGFIATNTTGTSCLGPLEGLSSQRALYEASIQTLSDPTATTIVLVSRPEGPALTEAGRTWRELGQVADARYHLVINGVFKATDSGDRLALALEELGREALREMNGPLAQLPRSEVPLLPFAPMGVERLRALASASNGTGSLAPPSSNGTARPDAAPLSRLIDEIAASGRGVVMTMGKGGVGKTTVAAAIATELASRGFRVHLTTTDPAAHVAAAVGDGMEGLTVSRIDPEAVTRKYTDEVLATAGSGLDHQGLALLEEDLRSPCTEEIAVFRAFAQVVAGGEDGFVVVDTAPTGHTLLLLDAAEAYHREVLRTMSDMPDHVRRLLPRLRDPEFTRVLLVTLPEATPVHEAARLQEDLTRAGIGTFGWVVNRSLAAAGATDPVLHQRGNREIPFVEEVRRRYASRFALLPWEPEPPTGTQRLLALARERRN
ncbi:MAG: arsenical pump-driving ATPase [Chloroflexi bacterium]|nr:arsenical pump-driving ATPase [Chloroflexota bacterium]